MIAKVTVASRAAVSAAPGTSGARAPVSCRLAHDARRDRQGDRHDRGG